MGYHQELTAYAKGFYVISHERSGTHFLMNCIQLNSSIDFKCLSVGEWFGPFDQPQTQFEHIYKRFSELNPQQHYILKTHCDRDLHNTKYPKGKIVYIFRDYRDVLVSYYYFLRDEYIASGRRRNQKISSLWFSRLDEFIRRPLPDFLQLNYSLYGYFSSPIERWLNHVVQWIDNPPEHMQIVTYNQLYYHPEETTQKLLKFLELPSKAVFTRPTFENSLSVMPRKGIVGDWKNHFSTKDAVFLDTAVSEYLPLIDRFPWNLEERGSGEGNTLERSGRLNVYRHPAALRDC